MPVMKDGPSTDGFKGLTLKGNVEFARLGRSGISKQMATNIKHAPQGNCVAWGLPFKVNRPVLIRKDPVTVKLAPTTGQWVVFMHTADVTGIDRNNGQFISPMRGSGELGVHVADYVLIYADGSQQRAEIRRRFQIGAMNRWWGENCFEAVADRKPAQHPSHSTEPVTLEFWGQRQTRAATDDLREWVNWLWAWENPHPRKAIVAIRFEPAGVPVLISGLSVGKASSNPLRWETRQKAVLTLPKGKKFNPLLDELSQVRHIHLDMGQVISASPRTIYPNDSWGKSYNNKLPDVSDRQVLVEYSAHPDAKFHLPGGKTVPVARLTGGGRVAPLEPISQATQQVTLRTVVKGSRKPVAVKLHVHGQAGEYLAPNDRHRIINADWFQDYSVDFSHQGIHHCSYVPGETVIKLPLGKVYIEVSKGYEIRPIRKVVNVTRATDEITIEIEKHLPWRKKNWVSADTHVHFLSPSSALLEGAGEGVNVVNLLASQWGELMTNVGDFDGKTTHGSRESGGDGEYLVRVGTENRQHVMGHISLLGYNGNIIAPMTTGGPDESAIGDSIEVLLSEWARQCKSQGGLVVIPHFPNPRCEAAATIVAGDADGIEMTSWGNLYAGINPYSLSDWYRYLNCGYFVPAVAGTDKMSAKTAVGTVRTYARVDPRKKFDYGAWMDAVRSGNTFVTYGPLMEFAVEGKAPGKRIKLTRTGGTVDVTWNVASVTVPMSRVELMVNGEIRESRSVKKWEDSGSWSVKIDKSSWVALLVRGHYRDKPEIIAAHSSPVMVDVKGSQFFAAADALTILEQIEGAMAFLDTVGTRAETVQYKRMQMVLTSAHRSLHNRMHKAGYFHKHTPAEDHPEHRQ